MTICFLDKDIILKLVACDLFADAIASLGIQDSEIRILSDTRFRFAKHKEIVANYSDAIRAKAIAVATSCPTVEPENSEELAALLKIEGVDLGEAKLVVATRKTPTFWLWTGDKKFIKASPNLPKSIHDRLCGRIICLEQIILKLIHELGFEAVQQRVFPAADCDKTLKICFGYSGKAPETEVRSGLNSYINDLRKQAPGLLAEL